jgi:hypothetical protein
MAGLAPEEAPSAHEEGKTKNCRFIHPDHKPWTSTFTCQNTSARGRFGDEDLHTCMSHPGLASENSLHVNTLFLHQRFTCNSFQDAETSFEITLHPNILQISADIRRLEKIAHSSSCRAENCVYRRSLWDETPFTNLRWTEMFQAKFHDEQTKGQGFIRMERNLLRRSNVQSNHRDEFADLCIISGVLSAGWLDIHFTVGISCESASPLAEENAAAHHHVPRTLKSLQDERQVLQWATSSCITEPGNFIRIPQYQISFNYTQWISKVLQTKMEHI